MDIAALLVALVTLAAGLVIGLLVGRSRGESRHRAQLVQIESAGRGAVERLTAELSTAHADASGLRATLDAERAAAASRDAEAREREAALAAEREQTQAQANAQLREAFGSLAQDALRNNNEAFAELADARLTHAREGAENDLAHRQVAIEALVTPMREALEKVQNQLTAVERDRVGSYEKLLEQVGTMRQTSEQLRGETAQLVSALRAPQVRGQWGELQLRRTVEAAGMTEHIDFVEQASVDGPDGRLRPDMVVHLAGGKHVVVDSKVAFSGFLEASQATDPKVKSDRLKAHARHLRTHIDQLAAKSYWEHFEPAPEFVVCFVPADAFLDAALQEDPNLQTHAFERNVVLATPSTLVALLRTVAYTWRQEALAANAAEVHTLGRELYQRLATLGKHFDTMGRSLNRTVGSYNEAVASLESRVFVTARKMSELKVVDSSTDLAAPKQVTETTRTLQAQEVAEQRLVAIQSGRGARAGTGQGDLLSDGDPADGGRRATS